MRTLRTLFLGALIVALTACSPVPAPGGVGEGGAATPGAERTLNMVAGSEPGSVAVRALVQSGAGRTIMIRLFNAQLAHLDGRAQPVPQLAETLPQLNTESWRILPSGRMETTFRLKSDLTWHDGAPLSAEDFVFSWRVYTSPEVGGATSPPVGAMEEVLAPDTRTVVIRWSGLYPEAGSLAEREREFPPLPRHLLGEVFEFAEPGAFANHPYWSRDFVGAGPYRVDRWEPGSFIDAIAFDGYALGRPKIDRIQLRFITDTNTLVANLLSGEIQMAGLGDLGSQQFQTIKRDWERRGAGRVLREAREWGATYFQLRPEFNAAPGLLDPRVRKALAHAVDKPTLDDALYDGEGTPANSMFSPLSAYGSVVERSVVRYPYDLRRSERYMAEAGYTRGSDGIYLEARGASSDFAGRAERFSAELKTNAGPVSEAELLIMADGWRKAGFGIQEAVLPAALIRNAEARAGFSAMHTYTSTPGENALVGFTRERIPAAENRWLGGNRPGWSDPEYERLVAAFTTTLDRDERAQQVARMVAIFTDALPAVSLFFRPTTEAYVGALRGPNPVAPESNVAWNVHTWEFE